jgi:hypothetical protein
LPISVRGDSLMHVGIGRGMRTGPDKNIEIGRNGYGESLMHVGIGRGIRTGPDKDIEIGRGAVSRRGATWWLGGYYAPGYRLYQGTVHGRRVARTLVHRQPHGDRSVGGRGSVGGRRSIGGRGSVGGRGSIGGRGRPQGGRSGGGHGRR